MENLPLINLETGQNFDLSAIVKLEPFERFHVIAFDMLVNSQSLRLNGNQMMFDFSDNLTEFSFKSLKRLDFSGLSLDIDALAKFEKILSFARSLVVIRSTTRIRF